MGRKKAIVAGHICIDIIPVFSGKEEKEIEDLFRPGQLVAMEPAKISVGGAVSNTGVGMKLLGADVELMGMTGTDAFGQIVRKVLEKYGAWGDSMISREDCGTSYSIILAPPGIDRIALHHTGANDVFMPEDVDFEKVKKANLFHFGYPSLMKKLYENGGKEFIRFLKMLHETDTAISVDMAMFEEDTEADRQDWNQILKEAVPYMDFFVPSVEELCLMLDRERYSEWKSRAKGGDITKFLDVEKDVKPLADTLLSYGAKVILIKCGAPGLYFRTADRERLLQIGGGIGEEIADSWADREYFEKSYLVEKVVSGIGAGDTTIAAFLTAVLEGKSWQDTLHLAAATGALCVQTYDALGGIIPLEEVQKRIDSGWEKRK